MKSSLLTLNDQPAFPKLRLDGWLITAIAALMIGLGYAFALAPEAAFQLLIGDRNESGSIPEGALACGSFLGGLLGMLGLPLLLLAPIADREIRKRIALGLFVTTLFVVILPNYGPSLDWPVAVHFLLILGASGLITPFLTGASRKPYVDARKLWGEQIREAAAQQERNRLARDLHDSIKQQLFSIRVGSAAVEARWDQDPQGAREALVHVRKSAHEATVEMQALLLQLRPEALATVGLVEALREQCESLGYRTGATVDLEVGDLPADSRWPAGSQEALFRVAQEAMANVARHARATKVLVRLDRSGFPGDETLVLEVRDDGQGFESSGTSSGMGRRNMAERIEAFGGTLATESVPGQGTHLTARLPIRGPNATGAPPPLKKATLRERWGNGEQLGVFAAIAGIALAFPSVDADLVSSPFCALFAVWLPFSTLASQLRRQETRSAQTAALNQLFAAGVALCLNPLITSAADSRTWRVITWLILAPGFFVAIDFVRRWHRAGGSAGPRSQNALFVVLLAGFLSAPLPFFIASIPEAAVRVAQVGFSLLFLGWWLQSKMMKETYS